MTDLIKWRPFHGLMKDFFNDMDPFFGNAPALMQAGVDFNPLMDIKDTEKELSITIDIPGMDKKDIQISIEESMLTIKGEKKAEKQEEKDGYVHTERHFGSFLRRIQLPENVIKDKLNAEYKDGVLKLTAPKKEAPKPETKKVEVK